MVQHRIATNAWETAAIDLTFRASFNAGKAVTTTSVSCPASAKIGVATSCSVTVANAGTGPATPTGQVAFDSLPNANAVPTGSCNLNGSGQCTYNFTPGSGSGGAQTVNANYFLGDATHLTSADGTSMTVNRRAATQSDTTCVPATLVLGQSATCSTTVTDTDTGTVTTPTGNATWNHTGSGSFAPSASCALTQQAPGTAECAAITYTPTAAGSHSITATYPGDGNHLATGPAAAGSLTVTEPPAAAPDCSDLLRKLKRLKRKLKKTDSASKKSALRKKIRKTRRELSARGC
jgi:hypothetical protein